MNKLAALFLTVQEHPVEYLEEMEKTAGWGGAGIGASANTLATLLENLKNPLLRENPKDVLLGGALTGAWAGHGLQQAIKGPHTTAARIGGAFGGISGLSEALERASRGSLLGTVESASPSMAASLKDQLKRHGAISSYQELGQNPWVSGTLDTLRGSGYGAASGDMLGRIIAALRGK
jgi:hypothetical protein